MKHRTLNSVIRQEPNKFSSLCFNLITHECYIYNVEIFMQVLGPINGGW